MITHDLEKISFDDIPTGRFIDVPPKRINLLSLRARGLGRGNQESSGIMFRSTAPPRKARARAVSLEDSFLMEKEALSAGEIDEVAGESNYLFQDMAAENFASKGVRPDELKKLEGILSKAYDITDLQITSIDVLPVTRKEVKRVNFLANDSIFQVWVFKTDPKNTARELAAYSIAYAEGIPTARPLGFDLENHFEDYPYDVAILGGIVENAGSPYNDLIHQLRFAPNQIFKTAEGVARVLADFHYKLTRVKEKFSEHGITLKKSSPRDEIKSRLMQALSLNESNARGLINASEELYSKQEGELVVSHCDIHTKNVVTLIKFDDRLGQAGIRADQFGVIDLGSIGLDYAEGDLADFWLHHQREALSECGNYGFNYISFKEAYRDRIKEHGIEMNFKTRNNIISQALWNLYELFDPVREDKLDIQQKARYHASLLRNNLSKLKKEGYSLGRELKAVLRNTEYSDVWQ